MTDTDSVMPASLGQALAEDYVAPGLVRVGSVRTLVAGGANTAEDGFTGDPDGDQPGG